MKSQDKECAQHICAFPQRGARWHNIFNLISRIILGFFFLELCVKIYAVGPGDFFFHSKIVKGKARTRLNFMSWLDVVVITLSCVVEYIAPVHDFFHGD